MDVLDILGCAVRRHGKDGDYRICFRYETKEAMDDAYERLIPIMGERVKHKAMIDFREKNKDLTERELLQLGKDMYDWGPEDWKKLEDPMKDRVHPNR
ncbi:MAG TPA: hypothetical protein VF783_17885 [Terriglobales bacterium]